MNGPSAWGVEMFVVWMTALLMAPVHLGDLLAEAQANNGDVAAAAARSRAATLAADAAGAWDDPMVMAQLWNMPMDFSVVPLMIEVSQPVLWSSKRQARRDGAEADTRLAEALLQQQRRELDAGVATAYFDVFMAEQTLAVNGHLAETLGALRDVATHRAATGLADQTEALRLQSELITLEGENIKLRAQRLAANGKLVALLNRDPNSDIGTPMPPHGPVPLPSQAVLRDKALAQRPEVQALHAMVAKANAEARLAEADGLPQVTPVVGYMRDFGGSGEHNFGIVGLSTSLPIFRESKVRPRVAAAQAHVQAFEESLRALTSKIGGEIAALCAEADAEEQTIAIHHRLIPLSQQTLSTAMSSYTVGRGSFLDVLVSLRELQTHQLDLARHLAAYEQRLADLERATNTDLGLRGASEGGAAPSHEGAME